MDLAESIFAGVYPAGVVYADRTREVAGDYARLAFLPFGTLRLRVERRCSPEQRAWIERDAQRLQAMKGQHYQVSTAGQTVLLGAEA